MLMNDDNKNNDFVGVDDKYIPQYAQNEKDAKNNSSDAKLENSKRKIKKVVKTAIGIYLFWGILILALVIGIIIFAFSIFNKIRNTQQDMINSSKQQQQEFINAEQQQQQQQQDLMNQAQQQQQDLMNQVQQQQHKLLNQ